MDSHSSRRRRDSRSRSPERRHHHRDRDRDRDRDQSQQHHRRRSKSPDNRRNGDRDGDDKDRRGSLDYPGLPNGVSEIDKDDFYLKASEFKLWLYEEKDKRLDQLKSEDARHYFRKFVKSWNRGLLASKYYSGISAGSLPSNVSSSHVWKFSKASQRELDDASSIRKSIDTGSKPLPGSAAAAASRSIGPSRGGGGGDGGGGPAVVGPSLPPATSSSRGPMVGPSMPPSALEGLQQSREAQRALVESSREAARAEQKRARRDEREAERDGRATGRDRVMEKRAEVASSHRAMRDAREGGGGMMEFDDDTLMGGGGDFKSMLAARDRSKTTGKRAQAQEERQAVMSDRMREFKAKEDSTMAAFRALAAERFGPK